jgi:hypothetical protein
VESLEEVLEETDRRSHLPPARPPATGPSHGSHSARLAEHTGNAGERIRSDHHAALVVERHRGRQLQMQLASSVRQLRAREAAAVRLEKEKATLRAQLLRTSITNAERDAVLVRVALPSP